MALLMAMALLVAGCGRTSDLPDPCANGQCPCVYSWDCPAGYDCIDRVCVQRLLPDAAVDASPQLKGFGELCGANEECDSGYCLPDLQGSFCTVACQGECPDGWACRQVTDPRGGTTPIGLCVVDRQRLCQPCLDNTGCNPSGGDLCLVVSGSQYCALDCTYEPCLTGYTCTDVPTGPGQNARQCLPASGTCLCTEASAGQIRGCQRESGLGICSGQEICQPPTGWSECSAHEPAAESCNGVDDNCNGSVDEGLDPRLCTESAGEWTCVGTETCEGSSGWICDAPVPEPESCDGHDNNCNGAVDEDFVDAAGRYFTREHCGGCGIDCDQVIANSAVTECQIHEGTTRCIATACLPGYFPYLEGTLCLQLPDNLCDPCTQDDDCVAPDSRCIDIDTERYCGRDCSVASPYGTGCPVGYQCLPHDGGMQCQPTSGTCLCTSEHAGTTRACTLDWCAGYQDCVQSAGVWNWSVCDISSTVEICDGLDNNCDGAVDEGFLNQVTGRYESDEHCGWCNNDCTKYWSAEIHHAVGGCNTSPSTPTCEMDHCLTEVIGGVNYEWVNVNGDDFDGCECLRVAGNLTVDLPDRGAFPVPGASYEDENCDGVDGVIAHAIFVWGGNPNPGTGTRANPYQTLGQALTAFPGSGKAYILVAEGTYQENLILFDGVQLFGGYASDFLSRDVLLFTTTLQGVSPASGSVKGAITATGLGTGALQTVVSGFYIQGRDVVADTPNNTDGDASIAIYLASCGPNLVIQNNIIEGGRGGPGGRGSTGDPGYGRQNSGALDGGGGLSSQEANGPCPAGLLRLGGGGGNNSVCTSADANDGGFGVCPTFNFGVSPYQGGQQQYSPATGNDGAGGWDWSFDSYSGGSCSHVTESGWPTNIQTHHGSDGLDGLDGNPGSRGGGCANGFGSISALEWIHTPVGAAPGGAGTLGAAGGGGGAGGGTAYYPSGSCNRHNQGATGGGGAAGGCGGRGGLDGGNGGASIGILAVFGSASPATSLPTITQNRLRRGPGGAGGDGGFGGPGGQGGNGGNGGLTGTCNGSPDCWYASLGGKGGDGGNGGPGGGGGGGCGGPSVGILGFHLQGATWGPNNIWDLAASVDTGGLAGVGGGAASPSSVGENGEDGKYYNFIYVRQCGVGGTCPINQTCDTNNVCIPN